jgi:hypothetical protein
MTNSLDLQLGKSKRVIRLLPGVERRSERIHWGNAIGVGAEPLGSLLDARKHLPIDLAR